MKEHYAKTSALAVSAITSFAAPFMISAINIALPSIQKEFSAHAVLLSWVATSYLLTTAVVLVPAGKFADIYGRKKVFAAGIVLFAISAFCCAFANSIHMLIAIRAIQGIGGAMTISTGMAIIISVFPVHERGKAIGINVAAVYTGLSAGPFFGGMLTQYLSWRSIFLIGASFGVIAFLLTILFLKAEWMDAKGEKFDVAGALIYAFALVSLMYGASILPGKSAICLIAAGIAGFFVFVRHESKALHPIFEIRLFKENRVFTFSCLAALINYAATFGVTFLLSLYLQYIMGLPPQSAGIVLVVQPVMQALLSPFAGKLSDRVDPGIIASAGMTLTVIGLFLLQFITPDTTIAYFVAILFILGLGFALFSSPNMNAIMSSVEKKHYGVASGSVATMRTVGMTFSMAIISIVFAFCIGKSEISPATYPEFIKSVKIAFTVFTLLCGIGIYFSSARGNLR